MENVATWLLSSPPAAWLQALGTPIIGLVAAYVAFQSAGTARNKLKFDMFEKRLQTYRELSTLISDATQAGWMSWPLMETFGHLQAQARFLFSDEAIDAHLSDVGRHLFVLIPPANLAEGDEKTDREIRLKRRQLVLEWNHRLGTISQSREELRTNNPWLTSASWLYERKVKLDSLTLPYLRLSH
ncbi:hypothetical protein [Achromobacter sp.]|uniref:hypothetical protein n=1 Tax=Achromobacter sp. TaxID=134375 RepID=UPI0028AE8B55|nr:hypothetical protein [Achromobacter sp.]